MFKRLIISLVCFTFIFSNLQYVHAQDFSINQLPVPGTMVGESAPFAPLALKGLIVNLQKPLEFQFIVDTGKGPQDTASIREEATQLVKYFLAGLTIPEGDLWVNLSPYEKNRMVPQTLGQTDLGRDLLAQDYILKQLTASLIYPEKDLGKKFWSRVYAKAQVQFGTTNVPVNTFNKVWILPDEAQIYENVNAAYVTKSTLKVMLDEDYTALQKHMSVHNSTDSIGSNIVRQIILPEIEKEVNTGKNFTPLRQIYQALILAKWYKETIQNGLLDAVYTNKNKVAGVNLSDPTVKAQIYERYLKAYKKGAFNYIKEDPTPDGQVVTRKYFSGGIPLIAINLKRDGAMSAVKADGAMLSLDVSLLKHLAPQAPTMVPGGLPLLGLQDPEVVNVFRQIVERRYDVRILAERYGLGNVPEYLTYQGKRLSVKQYANLLVDFMIEHLNDDPNTFAKLFREKFPKMARPPELDKIFDAYMGIKLNEFDLEVVKDTLPANSIVADIGAGSNQLGTAILKYSDVTKLGIKNVLGTDITDYRDSKSKDYRLKFFHQQSGTFFPLPSNSLDVVIIKWVLHHMSNEDQTAFLKSIWRVLKPGGRLIVFDSLGTMLDELDIQADFIKEINNPQTWPKGSYFNDNLKLTQDFLRLDPTQQRMVHALEDYFGHNLVMGRDFMPQPFTYLPVKDIRDRMSALGMVENSSLRRVYGSAPIMRMGPPSIRMVFEKSEPKPNLVVGDGGENQALILIPGMKDDNERDQFKNVLDVLVDQDRKRISLETEKADDIVLVGNDRLDTIAESLELLNAGIGKRVVVLGQIGMATIPLIDKAVEWGYKISIAPGVILNKTSWPKIREQIVVHNRLNLVKYPEGQIIRQIMMQMIQNFPEFFKNLQKINDANIDEFIKVVGDPGANTKQIFINYRNMLDREKDFQKGTPHKVIFVQKPHLQLRARASFEELFSKELRIHKVELLSHTVSFDNISYDKPEAIKELVTEAWKVLIYSEHGKGDINLRSDKYPQGIYSLDQKYWDALVYLLARLRGKQKTELAQELLSLSSESGVSIEKLLNTDNPGIVKFVKKIQSAAQKDSAMTTDEIKNLLNNPQDLNGTNINNTDVQQALIDSKDPVLLQRVIYIYTNEHDSSFDYPGFSISEFSDNPPGYGLLHAIYKSGFHQPFYTDDIRTLNEFLDTKGLRNKFPNLQLPPQAADLVMREKELTRNERRQLNRLILEAAYPQQCPKMHNFSLFDLIKKMGASEDQLIDAQIAIVDRQIPSDYIYQHGHVASNEAWLIRSPSPRVRAFILSRGKEFDLSNEDVVAALIESKDVGLAEIKAMAIKVIVDSEKWDGSTGYPRRIAELTSLGASHEVIDDVLKVRDMLQEQSTAMWKNDHNTYNRLSNYFYAHGILSHGSLVYEYGDYEELEDDFIGFRKVPAHGWHTVNRTDLRGAALHGDIKRVVQLLANGADVNARGEHGKTALIQASSGGHPDVVELLLAKGADVNAKAYNGETALISAAFELKEDYWGRNEWLWAGGVGHAKKDYETIAQLQNKFKTVVKLLIKKGADVNAKANNGETALSRARMYQKWGIVEILKAAGAKDNAMLQLPKLTKDKAALAENGGIDLNQINVKRNGKTVNVQFDPAQLNQLIQGGFEGFSFKIENMSRISSPFQLLGINAPSKQVLLVKV